MPVKSADRVIAILELFALRQKALNLTEIASELGYPMSSTLAILQSLCVRQYLQFDGENKTYEPTLRVAMMGGWVMGKLFNDGAVIAFMHHLQKDTGETIILGGQNGLYAQYLHTVQSRELLRFYLPPGIMRPMTQSAIGKALLTRYSNPELEALAARLNKESVLEKNLINAEALVADIDQVRKQGYAYTDRLTEGICAIGATIPLVLGQMPCAIAVAGPVFRLKRKKEKVAKLISLHAGQYLTPGHIGFGHA
jgi:DNA-binding IclR family transcriptional regulator